ncbi:MAG: polysaccharide pyruvyl transferase family protein [Oscillospiraceae bacterium]|nr:polysaccharide pyruvyl transferase family protein [Oscillospiraceae bacterium]
MIGVCIKYFHENYGGMLQAYATASMLEARGLEYELIQYEKKRTIPGMIRSLPRLLNRVLLNDKYEAFLKKQGMKAHPEFAEMDAVRMQSFKVFKESHFTRLSPVFKGYDALCEGAKRYSAVVTGSDQLWSPAGLPTNYYNLMFVPEEIRKISYASSFGVSYIPWYQKKRTAQYLNRIEFVSMRENKGAQLVKELTGREVPTILDPVFMFDKAGWEKLIPAETIVEEPYILAYFLGANPVHREAVKQAAKELGCKIVTLPHMDQYVAADEDFGDYRLYDVGPDKFLNLLRGAQYVCTDSFHGSCFAIIHGIPFVTFSRYDENSGHSKNSRIDTLCGNLGLQDRRFRTVQELGSQLAANVDWDAVAEKFAKLKVETDQYLNDAFDGIA